MAVEPRESRASIARPRFDPREAGRFVARARPVNAVGLEERAASLAKRSIKREAKLFALDLAIRCMDLTTLEGADTPGKAVAICAALTLRQARSVARPTWARDRASEAVRRSKRVDSPNLRRQR